jgi:hypothetical protein
MPFMTFERGMKGGPKGSSRGPSVPEACAHERDTGEQPSAFRSLGEGGRGDRCGLAVEGCG